MWIIGPDAARCEAALGKLRSAICELAPGPIIRRHLPGNLHLVWFRAKPSDNLHEFDDGYVLGKLAFDEASSEDVIKHVGHLPSALHPLLLSTRLRVTGSSVMVNPNTISPVFYRQAFAADTQLAVALATGARPAPAHFSVLAAVGYLPGTLTLFDEIRKLDLFEVYDLTGKRAARTGSFEPLPADDDAMIQRLTSLVPKASRNAIGISGGCDSRFVLGILLRAGVRPRLIHLESAEAEIVRQLGQALALDTEIVQPSAALPGRLYTILTDGQIYFRGGNYSVLRHRLKPNVVYHCGLVASSLLKNGCCQSAWKLPGTKNQFLRRLVRYGLLNTAPPLLGWLRGVRRRADVEGIIWCDYQQWRPLLSNLSRKAAGNWFDYHSSGIRWCYATTLDLQFFCYVVFLLSDLEALRYGIGSSIWSNLQKARVRHLNRLLLPEVQVPYADGLPADPPSGVRLLLEGLRYEYFDRLKVHLADQKQARAPSILPVPEDLDAKRLDLSEYLTVPLERLLADERCPRSVKRAAITLAYVLQFLEED